MKNKKLKEMVLYVADKSKDDPAFGETKLNKILFTADFYHYGLTGKSITGSKYFHINAGPAPKEMIRVLKELLSEDKIKIEETIYFGFKQKKVIPKITYDLRGFSDDEKNFVDSVIKKFERWNGSDLTNWTHSLIPWLITSDKEDIPYHSIFMLKNIPVEADGIAWAKKRLNEIKSQREAI
jgi:hypothetical protein